MSGLHILKITGCDKNDNPIPGAQYEVGPEHFVTLRTWLEDNGFSQHSGDTWVREGKNFLFTGISRSPIADKVWVEIIQLHDLSNFRVSSTATGQE